MITKLPTICFSGYDRTPTILVAFHDVTKVPKIFVFWYQSYDIISTIPYLLLCNPWIIQDRELIFKIVGRRSGNWDRWNDIVWLVSKDKDLWHLSNIMESDQDRGRTIIGVWSFVTLLSWTIYFSCPWSYAYDLGRLSIMLSRRQRSLIPVRIWGLRSSSSGSTIIVRNHNKI